MPYDFPMYINGEHRRSDTVLKINSPYDQHFIGQTYRPGNQDIEDAIQGAVDAFQQTRQMPLYERVEKLQIIIDDLHENQEDFAKIISEESAKPINTARGEAARAISTFTDALEESKRMRGEHMPLDFEVASKGRWAIIRRFPIGPILGISPFNFPLNLVCHKVAPALASGNSIILKPASQTPLSALRLAQSIEKADWPKGSLNVIPALSSDAHLLLEDDRIKMVTFTGSPEVGWALKNKAGRKQVTLELGGNAGVIIHDDGDLAYAAERCAIGGYVQSGQNCISVQRIFVHQKLYKSFMDIFCDKVRNLKVGDPASDDTFVGPMIHKSEVKRVTEWIKEAIDGGAKIEVGGGNEGNFIMPTILSNVDPSMKVSCQEVFAPLTVVYKFDTIGEALDQVNNSDYGLQAGLFTQNASVIFEAFEKLEVGGLVIGDVPTYRVDPMPYGGTKLSGMGREGVRFAMEEMTELKLLVMNV